MTCDGHVTMTCANNDMYMRCIMVMFTWTRMHVRTCMTCRMYMSEIKLSGKLSVFQTD
jgi:hypothetical protein